jgi:hypothetical protein
MEGICVSIKSCDKKNHKNIGLINTFKIFFFWLQGKRKQKKKEARKQERRTKELLSRIESSNCIHPEKVQEIIWKRDIFIFISVI